MKKLWICLICMAGLLILGACGGGSTAESAQTEAVSSSSDTEDATTIQDASAGSEAAAVSEAEKSWPSW